MKMKKSEISISTKVVLDENISRITCFAEKCIYRRQYSRKEADRKRCISESVRSIDFQRIVSMRRNKRNEK